MNSILNFLIDFATDFYYTDLKRATTIRRKIFDRTGAFYERSHPTGKKARHWKKCRLLRDRIGWKIIARGYNRRNTDKNTLSHAELNAIRKASKKLGDWRLEGCTMYVTLEPVRCVPERWYSPELMRL